MGAAGSDCATGADCGVSVWAGALEALIVMSHLLTVIDLRPPLAAFYAVINLASYGILVAIAAGTAQAWRDRRAFAAE